MAVSTSPVDNASVWGPIVVSIVIVVANLLAWALNEHSWAYKHLLSRVGVPRMLFISNRCAEAPSKHIHGLYNTSNFNLIICTSIAVHVWQAIGLGCRRRAVPTVLFSSSCQIHLPRVSAVAPQNCSFSLLAPGGSSSLALSAALSNPSTPIVPLFQLAAESGLRM
jgi:hypothetical protein